MATIKAVKKKTTSTAGLKKAIDYIEDPKKTLDGTLLDGVNCNPQNAFTEFMLTKEMYEKTDKVMAHHFSQNFDPNDKISPEKALELGKELAEKHFKGFEVVISTHVDKKHIHNHILVNSVSFETGMKFDNSPELLESLKIYSDLQCEREGLSIVDRNKKATDFDYGIYDKNKYEVIMGAIKGEKESYIWDLRKNVNISMNKATSKEQFIQLMNQKGYKVNWSDTRKYITFVPPQGRSVRDKNLAKTFNSDKYTKEGLLNEFRRNREIGDRETKHEVNTRGINNGDNRTIDRNRIDIENSIIFGRVEVPSIGDDKSFNTDKEVSRENGVQNGAIGGREEPTERILREGEKTTGGIQYEEYTEPRQDSARLENGNEGTKRLQLQEDRGNSPVGRKISDFNTKDIHDLSRDTRRSQEHEGIEELEGKVITVHNATRSDGRDNINGNGGLSSSSELLDKIANQFEELEPSQKEHDVNVDGNDKEVDIVEQMFAKDEKALKEYKKLKAQGEFKSKDKSNDIDFDR